MGSCISCSGSGTLRIVAACSGLADASEISDRAARRLHADGTIKMACLVGIPAGDSGIITSARSADAILSLDGCSADCALGTLVAAGFTKVKHLRATGLGFQKSASPVSGQSIATVALAGASALNGHGCLS